MTADFKPIDPGRYGFLVALFVSALVCANLIATKMVQIWFVGIPVAIFAYPVTFLATDVISEVWGKRVARNVVWYGFVSIGAVLLLAQGAIAAPEAPFSHQQACFEQVFGSGPRILAASLAAYLVSQHFDVFVFHKLREMTRGRWLWLRNNVSTVLSQGIDSAVFITGAFAGEVPSDKLLSIVITYYLFKVAIALVDTPFCYLLVRWAKC